MNLFAKYSRIPAIWLIGSVIAFIVITPLAAQTFTGTIRGSVADASNASVGGATVTLRGVATGAERHTTTAQDGAFEFTSLPPAQYDLEIAAAGFKTMERHGIELSASQTLTLGTLTLAVGSVNEKVLVTAQAPVVEAGSSERSGQLNSLQVDRLLVRSRNVLSLLQLLPGVVDTATSPDVVSRSFSLSVNGNRTGTNSLSVDGMILNPMGNYRGSGIAVSQDSIAEVKVLLSNYQAEYGRLAGGNITLISKSGSNQFHGLASFFTRNEAFNANDFFANRLGLPRARYRFNTWNYNISGPVIIPKLFNGSQKLFFSFTQEYWPTKLSQPVGQVTVPTALERQGDFSQSFDQSGKLIVVKDPATGLAFPDNKIPANRLDPNGLALLNIFPAPNFTNTAISRGQYNYVFQPVARTPLGMQTARLDWVINAANTLSGTFTASQDHQEGTLGIPTSAGNWPQFDKTYQINGSAYVARYTHIFSPSLINEANLGFSRRPEGDTASDADLQKNQRDTVGFHVPQFSPSSNPLNVIPNATFSDITNAAQLQMESRFPFAQALYAFSLTDNLTKIHGGHTFKAGILVDRDYQRADLGSSFNGTFAFGRDTNNPLDSGYGYANAALGVFDTYTESSARLTSHFRQTTLEWFIQDNWRATKRLTLDLGVRLNGIFPVYDNLNQLSTFVPTSHSASQAVRLIAPSLQNGVRVGIDPKTGTMYPATLIGAIVPNSGNVANGMLGVSQNPDYPRGLMQSRGFQIGPRVGFAYDVFGNGKTAIRGGFGIFYNRPSMSDLVALFINQLPQVSTPQVYFGTLSGLQSSSRISFPSAVNALDPSGKIPSSMSTNFSVQQDIGFNTVLDVGYTGTFGRHLYWSRNLNAIPFGANFQTANADPTKPGTPLAPAFLRPYVGYNNIIEYEPAATSNYNSLQVSVNHRFSHGLQFGGSWTWSKAFDYGSGDAGDQVSVLIPVRVWNYGLSTFDRTHNVRVNWLYELPNGPFKSAPLRYALNGWEVAGIASFISGAPLGINFTTTNSLDITGSPTDSARVYLTGNPVLPKDQRSFYRNFDTSVVKEPAVGTFGNAPRNPIRGPGVNNFDLSLYKNFPIHESVRLQFRAEAYNVFNHTQFATIDTTARFDAAGNQINTNLSAFTSARSPRQLQLALRFYF